MNRNKNIYHNTIPPIKADCLLPKFKIPNFSQKFSTDSTLNKPSHEFRTDSLLGIKVELCDLSVYADCTPDPETFFDENDFKYYQELATRTQKNMLVVPVENLIPRSHPNTEIRSQKEKNQEKTEKTYYRKSKFYRTTEDPEIEDQLKNAFNGKVPSGEVHLLHQAPPLCTMIDRQKAKPLSSDSIILLSVGKKYLKVHDPPSEEDQPNVAKKAFSVTEKDTESNIEKAYLYIDDDGKYNLGVIRKQLTLSSVPNKDMSKERLTATPVIFQNAPIVRRIHSSHSEGEDNDNKNDEDTVQRKRSSSVSRSQSGSDRGSNSSKSSSSSRSSRSSRSSSSNSKSSSGSGSASASGGEEQSSRHRIRVKDFVSDKKEETEEKRKSDYSHSSDNEKKSNSSSHSKSNSSASSRSPSPKSNSDAESNKKSDSRSHSPSPAKHDSDAKSNSSRSGSDAENKKQSSRSNSGSSRSNSPSRSSSRSNSPSRSSSRSNSPSRSGSRSASKSPSRNASSDSDSHKD